MQGRTDIPVLPLAVDVQRYVLVPEGWYDSESFAALLNELYLIGMTGTPCL